MARTHQYHTNLAMITKNTKLLEEFSKHPNYVIQWAAARNPNMPVRILEEMSRDGDRYVRVRIASNPSITKKVITNILKRWENKVEIVELYKNPSIFQEMKDMIFIRTGIKNG